MSEMVERVAQALSLADPDERGLPEGRKMAEFYRELALAAIAAMREPTYQMSDYAFMTVEVDGHSKRTLIEAGWRAMIDAALAQGIVTQGDETRSGSGERSEVEPDGKADAPGLTWEGLGPK